MLDIAWGNISHLGGNFYKLHYLLIFIIVIISQAKEFRALYAKVISDKHEDVLSKFGAILAQGNI